MSLTLHMPETLEDEQDELLAAGDAANSGEADSPVAEKPKRKSKPKPASEPEPTDTDSSPASLGEIAEFEADLQDAGIIPPKKIREKKIKEKKKEEPAPHDPVADFRQKLRDASDELATRVLARMESEVVYKLAKAEEKVAAETLQSIANRGVEIYPLFDGNGQAKPVNDVAAAEAVKSDATEGEPVAGEDWKLSADISALGLSVGLQDKLTDDGIDTVGRLEQRRADISLGKEKWPKGIGKAAVTKIENAVVEWLAENQASDHVTLPLKDGGGAGEATAAYDANTIGDVFSRAAQLLAENSQRDLQSDVYQGGRSAFGKGFSLSDCCWTTGSNQDLWLLGFKDAEAESRE